MKYDIKLRPHHAKAFCNFVMTKMFLLTDEEYVARFQEKNKGYHNNRFVVYLKQFLENLRNKPEMRFLYTNDYDEVCNNCDIKSECEIQTSKLHILVSNLDKNALNELSLNEGEVYTINYLLESLSQN